MKIRHVIIYLSVGCSIVVPLKAFRAVSMATLEGRERLWAEERAAALRQQERAMCDVQKKYKRALLKKLLTSDVGAPSYEDSQYDALINDGFGKRKLLGITTGLYIKDFDKIALHSSRVTSAMLKCVLGHLCLHRSTGIALKEVVYGNSKVITPITESDITDMQRVLRGYFIPELKTFLNDQSRKVATFGAF